MSVVRLVIYFMKPAFPSPLLSTMGLILSINDAFFVPVVEVLSVVLLP